MTEPLYESAASFFNPSAGEYTGNKPGMLYTPYKPGALDAMGVGFVHENSFIAAANMLGDMPLFQGAEAIRQTGFSIDLLKPKDEIDEAIDEWRVWNPPDETYNPNLDPVIMTAPIDWQNTLLQAQSVGERDLILSSLESMQQEKNLAMQQHPGSYMLGAVGGALTGAESIAALGIGIPAKFAQIPVAIGKMGIAATADEIILQLNDPTRTKEEAKYHIAGGVLGAGALFTIGTAIQKIGRVRQDATMRYLAEIEHKYEGYREHGPPRTGSSSTAAGVADNIDELPFGGYNVEGPATDARPTLRINPEDEFDTFDPSQPYTRDTGEKFIPPKMGAAEGEKLAPMMGMEKLGDNPVKRTLQGESDYARGMLSHLVEHPFFQMKNLGNMATSIGVDRIIASRWLGKAMVPAIRFSEEQYLIYRARVNGDAQKSMFRQGVVDKFKARPAGVMSPNEFLEAVTIAKWSMKKGQENPLAQFPKEVLDVAKKWDDLVYKPLAEDAKAMRMFSIRERRELARLNREIKGKEKQTPTNRSPAEYAEELDKLRAKRTELEEAIKRADELDIDPGFANRIYRHDYLGTEEGLVHFRQILSKYGYNTQEADAIRQKILKEVPYNNLASDAVGLARSLKERTLADIPDLELAPFLEKNILSLGRYYALRMGSDVELMRKFGSVDLLPHIRNIEKEFDNQIAATRGSAARLKLEKQKRQAIEDIETIRDRVRGTYGMPDDPDSWSQRGIRIAKMWNATSMLTGALAAVPDIGNIILREGISRSFGTIYESFTTNIKGIKLAHQEANLAGEALDMYMSMRAALFADLGDSLSTRNRFERAMGAGTQAFFNINLMNQWNVSAKTVASLISGSRMLEDAVATSAHLRNSGGARIVWGDPVGRNGQIIAASYNRKTNKVTINQDELHRSFQRQAWKDPKVKDVLPIDDVHIKSFNDWKRLVIEHELAHADHPRLKGESLGAYENRINKIALRRMTMAGKKPKDFDTTRLRQAGISEDMARRIADEVENHGIWGQHVRIARSHLWDDQEAAQVFQAALGKEINTVIVTPGKGDLPNFVGGGLGHIIPDSVQQSARRTMENIPEGPAKEALKKAGSIFMSGPMSQLLMQFKSFGMAAQHRVLAPNLQQFNQNTMLGVVALVGLGGLVDYIRRQQNNMPAGDAGDQLMRAIERSGITGYMADVMRAVENVQNPLTSPGKVLETFGGPIVHQAQDLSHVLWDYGRLDVDSRTNAALVDMAPLSNVAHLRAPMDMLHHSLNAVTGVK